MGKFDSTPVTTAQIAIVFYTTHFFKKCLKCIGTIKLNSCLFNKLKTISMRITVNN